MADESSALTLPDPPRDSDYENIHDAVMETARGRWFLREYARRNRHADTKLLLAAIARLESALRHQQAVANAQFLSAMQSAPAPRMAAPRLASPQPEQLPAKAAVQEAAPEAVTPPPQADWLNALAPNLAAAPAQKYRPAPAPEPVDAESPLGPAEFLLEPWPEPAKPPAGTAQPAAPPKPKPAARVSGDPLAALNALSAEEKIALCS